MNYKTMSNADLLQQFEVLCFQITNFPTKKTLAKEFLKAEKEIAARLNISAEELKAFSV